MRAQDRETQCFTLGSTVGASEMWADTAHCASPGRPFLVIKYVNEIRHPRERAVRVQKRRSLRLTNRISRCDVTKKRVNKIASSWREPEVLLEI